MSIADPRARLLELAEARGASLSQLSRLIDRNTSYLQQFVRKGSPRKLEETDRRTLARFFGVDEVELGGSGEKSFDSEASSPRGGWVSISRLDVSASAGPGALGADERRIGEFGFSADWLREQGLDPAYLSAIAVEGDSMEPLLHDGDEILVDTTPGPPRDGIHVLLLGEGLHVKRIQHVGSGRLQLISANDAYPPIEVAADEVEIVGRVVWKGGRL